MRKTFLFLLLAFSIAGCTENPKTNASQSPLPNPSIPITLRGYYVLGDEVNMLRNCADNKQYWVRDATGSLDSL